MTTAKVLGVVVFSVLLTVSVVTASTAIAVDRTVLNTNHVSETLQENGVYATVTAEARQEASGQLDDELSAQQANIPDGIDLDIDPQEVMKTTITEEYLAGEFKRNVATGLAFFKGNTDEIDVQINLQPALNRLSDQFNSSVVTVDTVALAQQRDIQESAAGVTVDNDMIARLNADAGGYESVRRQIRVQAIEHRDLPLKIDEDDPDSVVVETVTLVRETDFTDLQTSVPVSKELLVTMNENASSYQEARIAVKSQAVGQLPFEIVSSEPGVDVDTITLAQETDFESDQYGIAVDDQQIETLNENETGYNQVRQDIRTQVRDNLPSSASEDDVDDVLLEANAELKRDARAQVQSQYGEEVSDETIDDIVALQNVVIDGLTDPGLTEFDEYTDRRDTAEANLETSLDDELDRGLEEANADMKRQAASDTRDRYAQDASEETVDNIVALQNVVIDGLTDPELTDFDEYTNRRDTAEADLEDAIDQEIADELDRARRNINADLERQIRDEFGSEVSNETIAAIAELQKTLVNGLISPEDDEFGAYETRREQAEGNLEESIASEIRDEIEEQADDQTSLADDFDEDNREISLARTTVELVSFAPLAAAVLAATLIGCVFALTRSARRTASATGFSLLSAGVLGTVTSLLASGPALDATEDAIRSEDASEIETTAIEGVVALIDSVFSTLTTQSLVLLVLGFVLLGVVYADRANYLPLGEE